MYLCPPNCKTDQVVDYKSTRPGNNFIKKMVGRIKMKKSLILSDFSAAAAVTPGMHLRYYIKELGPSYLSSALNYTSLYFSKKKKIV